MWSSQLFQSLCLLLLISAASAGLTVALIRHLRLLDVPNERSSHTTPTPRGGGLAIVAGFLLGIAALPWFGLASLYTHTYFLGFLLALLLIVLIALYDDFRTPGAGLKFAVQLLAILIAMASGVVFASSSFLAFFDLLSFGTWAWWIYPVTVVWILGLTNAYNFMDGLDGMAASTAFVASGFFALLAFQAGSQWTYLLALALAAGALGFLFFNWSPARIFMGDVGSTFLGFAFASLAILAARYETQSLPIVLMPLLLLHFLFDTVFTFLRRLLAGEVVWQAHRTHLYQLLNRLGYSHRQVSGGYALLAVLQGCAALYWADFGAWLFLPFLLSYGLLTCCLMQQARRRGLLGAACVRSG